MAQPKLGSGVRFASFVKKVEAGGQSADAAKAIAASAGRKKFGNKRMSKMAAAGKSG